MLHGDVLGERARLTPDREALVVVESGERFTYAQLDARASRTASALAARGVRRGDRYAVLLHNSSEFLDLFFAAGKSGAIVVPLSTRATAHELAPVIADAAVSAIFFGEEFSTIVDSLRPALPPGAAVVRVDDEWSRTIAGTAPADFARCRPEEIYALLYTSGTTGRPKGVMIPHRMVAWNGYNTAVCWGLRDDDRSPIFTPLYHAGGLGAFLVPIITAGGTIVLHRRFEAGEVWRTIEAERCTVALGVPTIYRILADAREFETADVSSIRWMISGGAPLPLSIIERYQRRGLVFKQGYGMTEVGVNCFSMTVEESFRKAGSIGRPMMQTEARIMKADGAEAAAGEIGELQFRGPHVSLGYWRNREATAAAWDEDGWFHTGDVARRDEEGFYTIVGREKEMIISGGVNIYPAEIEAALLSSPSISDAAVVGVTDEMWGEVPVAFIVPLAGRVPLQEEVNTFLLTRIGRHKLPKRYVVLEVLPRTAYGKVVKGELKKMLESAER